MPIEDNENKNEINYCVEELFNPSNDEKYEKKIDKKEKLNVKTEQDNNLEKLFEENDEGTSIRVLGNDNNDDKFNNYWVNNSYSPSSN